MQIAIISDTHDNIWKLEEAMPQIASADAVLHCGDLCSPFIVMQLGKGLRGKPVHVVWGNNDGDQRLLTLKAQEAGNVHIHGEFAELNLGGLSIAMNHYPAIAKSLAASGQYDLVCYGHDHTAHESQVGNTRLLNPGEIMGLYGRRTFAIFNTDNHKITWVELA